MRPSSAVVTGLGVAVGWLFTELLLRWGVGFALLSAGLSPVAADWTLLLVGVPLVAGFLSWIALRRGMTPGEWGHDASRSALAAGAAGAPVLLGAIAVTGRVDAALFGLDELEAGVAETIGDELAATPALAVLFLLGNGIAVPVAEEQVWRGIVQTKLVDAWGVPAGIGVTAALFALKHVVVDLSVARPTTLLALALGFGLLRHRYGTTSSTVAHLGVNFASSAALVWSVLA